MDADLIHETVRVIIDNQDVIEFQGFSFYDVLEAFMEPKFSQVKWRCA
jgi:hypothetical protein